MKKLFLLLIGIGIFIGSFITIRNYFFNLEAVDSLPEIIENEVYIDELNLPLIEVDTLNPLLTQNKQVSDVLKLIYEPLFDFDEKNRLVPTLVTEWNEKDDNTWILKLNNLATWHSGKKLSAEDVVFTFNSIRNFENCIYKENIKNISSVEIIDDNAIQINLVSNDKYLPYKLNFPIIAKHFFQKEMLNESHNEYADGTGPYKVESVLNSENKIILISNMNWWKQKDFKLNQINLIKYATYGEAIKAFKSTEIDVISTTMSSWQKKFGAIGINSYMYESNEYETLIANTEDIVLSEKSVRRMVLTGINAENIIESVYGGNGAVSDCPIPSNSYLSVSSNSKNYDIEKAKQLLINAGWDNSSGNWKKVINNKTYTLEFDLLVCNDNEEKIKIADLIVENLKEIGVKVKIVKLNFAEFNKRIQNGKFELALATINLDSDLDIVELIESTSEKNFANYKKIEVDNIISQMTNTNLDTKINELQNLYRNEAPYIGMYYKCNNLLTNKSVKGNINPTSWNVYHDITGWCK